MGAMRWRIVLLLMVATANPQAGEARAGTKLDGNRLAYLDELDPYYPHRNYPKLITPQWVGEDGVEAVVILAIDDMKDPRKYEAFLRPILRRLQKIDGRAPVSIMSCSVDPADPQLQTWLKEGLSIECHTFDHPCPFFAKGFDKAKETYEKCVDLMHAIPNTKPVAFRMPCCDSMNTPSPRFWAEIFNKTTAKGNFLTIDSSVFNVFTSDDPALPRELVKDEKGAERFKKYLPTDKPFVNTIENYPYPYVIGKLCWEFPCMTPSDWQAQGLHKSSNPQTVADWKAALDCTVIKQGVFSMVFHPHGWIKNDQIIELIDHAVAKHGKKVKFLTFKEAQQRLDKSLFDGKSLREMRSKQNVSVWLSDDDRDGYIDSNMIENQGGKLISFSQRWDKASAKCEKKRLEQPAPKLPLLPEEVKKAARSLRILNISSEKRQYQPIAIFQEGENYVIVDAKSPSYEDLLQDPITPLLNAKRLPFTFPPGVDPHNRDGHDAGLRFIDLDGDGKLDIIFSNEKEYGIYLFKDMKKGWSRKVMAGKAGDKDALPMILRNGTNNGFWVHSGQLWWSNEDTVLLKDHVDRRSIKELLERSKK
jgi:hypothetical protein